MHGYLTQAEPEAVERRLSVHWIMGSYELVYAVSERR